MFTSRKYTPLPTDSRQRKRAGTTMPAWKRYTIISGLLLTVGLLAFSTLGHRKSDSPDVYDAENTYTPNYENYPTEDVDETDYSSPPFRPEGSGIAEPGEEEDADEEEMHILPIDEDRPVKTRPGHSAAPPPEEEEDDDYPSSGGSASSPHDPQSDEALAAADADDDFTEIDDSVDVEDDEESSAQAGNMPTSFETDENPSATVACSKPFDENRPLVQYALTIDAGSQGSRIHVYKFHNCEASPRLEYETFKAVNPGLSSYARDPTAAAASLDPLLKEAERVVPRELWSCTPVEVKATAGLRLLGETESDAILDEVRNRMETNFKFSVGGAKSVEIMDGKDEGVYAWITANYLMGKIGEGVKSRDTLAVMDLGGASTQIVFEPQFPAKSKDAFAEGDHKYKLNFQGREHTLYQHSYLGYGLMRARRSVHNLVGFTYSFGQGSHLDWDEFSETVQVPNPCLIKGTSKTVELDPPGRKAVSVSMHGGNGGFEACNRIVELVMAKDDICEVKPCSFNGVYQPSLLDTFPKGKLLALSYFTDRIQPLLDNKSKAGHLTITQLKSMAQDVCAGPAAWKRRWGKNPDAIKELEDKPEYCLDLTFMHALLGLGYELGPERQLVVEKKLNGVELGWALGAGLALVGKAELTCTV